MVGRKFSIAPGMFYRRARTLLAAAQQFQRPADVGEWHDGCEHGRSPCLDAEEDDMFHAEAWR
jgi:hypothetical protein